MTFFGFNWRMVAIQAEAAVVLLGGWVAQGGFSGGGWDYVERWGGLGLAGIALWRLLWHELPAWREEFRAEREANAGAQRAEREMHAAGLADLADSIRDLAEDLEKGRRAAIKEVVDEIREGRGDV